MKDTIKNSIIVAFVIFGLVALISTSNTALTVVQEETRESHIWAFEIKSDLISLTLLINFNLIIFTLK